jgi:hypothetical protein
LLVAKISISEKFIFTLHVVRDIVSPTIITEAQAKYEGG